MQFQFLGTSSGVPTKQRNVAALAIKPNNSKEWCLVDCGEGTQQQILHTPHSLVKLKAIFITHVHGDHSYGLPGLLATAAMAGRTEPLLIVAPFGVEEFVRAAIQYTDMHLSYELNFEIVNPEVSIELDNVFSVSAIALSHRVPSFAYAFQSTEKKQQLDIEKLQASNVPKGPLWGRLANNENVLLENGAEIQARDYLKAPGPNTKVIIGGDNDSPELLLDMMKESDALIHEATYTKAVKDDVGPGPQHSSAEEVAKVAELAKIPNLILTHFSARYHYAGHPRRASITDVQTEAKTHYSGNLYLANDFDLFELSNSAGLIKIPAA